MVYAETSRENTWLCENTEWSSQYSHHRASRIVLQTFCGPRLNCHMLSLHEEIRETRGRNLIVLIAIEHFYKQRGKDNSFLRTPCQIQALPHNALSFNNVIFLKEERYSTNAICKYWLCQVVAKDSVWSTHSRTQESLVSWNLHPLPPPPQREWKEQKFPASDEPIIFRQFSCKFSLFFFKLDLFICFTCMIHLCMCTTCMLGAHRGQKRVSGILKPELQMAVSHGVYAGNWARVLRENSKYT